jgi:hypothetical protein
MKRKLIIWAILLAILVCVVTYLAWPREWLHDRLARSIKPGMTVAEAGAILGPPITSFTMEHRAIRLKNGSYKTSRVVHFPETLLPSVVFAPEDAIGQQYFHTGNGLPASRLVWVGLERMVWVNLNRERKVAEVYNITPITKEGGGVMAWAARQIDSWRGKKPDPPRGTVLYFK